MPFLKTNISKPWVTAKAGEEVSVISFSHFPVIIVANKEGVRFSVVEDQLEDCAPVADLIEIFKEPEIIKAAKPVKLQPASEPIEKQKPITVQSTLF